MASVASRVGLLVACLSLALPVAAWAGSSQASLAVSVTVPARCALRVAGAVPTGQAGGQAVTMKCTKGTLPSVDAAGPRRASAAEPRISREIVLGSVSAVPLAPLHVTEQGMTGPASSSLVVTVNF